MTKKGETMKCIYCEKREAASMHVEGGEALCMPCLESIIATHYCPEWDYMLIHRGMPEFEACTCNMP